MDLRRLRRMVVGGDVLVFSIGKTTFEDDSGMGGLERLGRKKWQKRVEAVTKRFVSALLLDEFVPGGGHATRLARQPMGCRMGDNANAFPGGFRMREDAKP